MANNQFNLSFVADLDRGITLTPLRQAFIEDDHQAHVFIVKAVRGGAAVPLAGAAVKGYFIPYGMETAVQLTGSVDASGAASVSLTRDCYAFLGRFNLVIQTTIDGVDSSIFYGEGYVTRTRTDKVIEPSGAVPSLGTLEQMIKNLTYADVGAAPAGYITEPKLVSSVEAAGYVAFSDIAFSSWSENTALFYIANGYSGNRIGAIVAIRVYGHSSDVYITYQQISGDDITDKLFYYLDPNTKRITFYVMVDVYEHAVVTPLALYGKTIRCLTDATVQKDVTTTGNATYASADPPMVSGVEYRTTERYLGKVVYAKSLNAGALPANTFKDVSLGVTITDLVDLKVRIQSSTAHMLLPDVENKVYAKVMWAGSVRIFALEADMSAYTGRITIKYTKD